jgi:hypothetical protein
MQISADLLPDIFDGSEQPLGMLVEMALLIRQLQENAGTPPSMVDKNNGERSLGMNSH